MNTAATQTETSSISSEVNHLGAVGRAADVAARRYLFEDYISRKAVNTIAAQRADLETWREFLAVLGHTSFNDADEFQRDPALWAGITWGLVESYVKWMLKQGYSIASVNRKLSTVKTYCKLAAKAGVIDAEAAVLIRAVSGYSVKEGKRVNEKRESSRIGAKKAEHVPLSADDAHHLKSQPSTPQGRRDAVVMAMLLDHGLRVSELAMLKVTDFSMAQRMFTFYRAKVDETQTHRMSRDAFHIITEWFDSGAAATGEPLLRGSRKDGQLTTAGMSARAITARVRKLGEALGIEGLSAHDCRHYWATRAATMGTDAFALRDAGGWSSMAMPARYVESAAIANDRVRL